MIFMLAPGCEVVTPTVWLYNTDGEIYFDRHIITYSEMLYVVVKLEIRILTEPRRRCFIDEFQDLKLLEMHVVLRMAFDARMLCARCNRPNMQIIFLGQQVQSIFADDRQRRTAKIAARTYQELLRNEHVTFSGLPA